MKIDSHRDARSAPSEAGQREGSGLEATYRLFLVDDHPVLREGLRDCINRQTRLTLVGDCEHGEHACQEIKALLPDLVLMDFAMKARSGAWTAQQIKRECPEVKVLAFTVYSSQSHLLQMFQAGASGYVLKSSATDILLEGIFTTLDGKSFLDPCLGTCLPDLLTPATEPLSADSKALSERERIVLLKTAQGYCNKEIAASLDISIKSVETYKTRGMQKLCLSSLVDVIRYAVAQNWLTASGENRSAFL